MEAIIEQITASKYFKQLPAILKGFALIPLHKHDGAIFRIFSYQNQQQRRSLTAVYDGLTKEYIVRVQAGLTEFCDIAYIVPALAEFERVCAQHLEQTLDRLGTFDEGSLEYLFRSKKIVEWTYAAQLPTELAGFEQYIKPAQPLKAINGSYVILDYSDFSTDSNLVIYYNIYRDEFFGEQRVNGVPGMASVFETKTLLELAERLSLYLTPMLTQMREKIRASIQE